VSIAGRKESVVQRRLELYSMTGQQLRKEETRTVLGDNAVARTAVEFAGKMVARRSVETGLARALEAGAIPLRPPEWLILHCGAAVLAPLLVLLLAAAALGGVAALAVRRRDLLA